MSTRWSRQNANTQWQTTCHRRTFVYTPRIVVGRRGMRPWFTLDVVGKCVCVSDIEQASCAWLPSFRSATSASRSCCSVIRACVLQPCAACVDELNRRRLRVSSAGPAFVSEALRLETLPPRRHRLFCERPSQGSTRCPFHWLFTLAALAQEWPLAGL